MWLETGKSAVGSAPSPAAAEPRGRHSLLEITGKLSDDLKASDDWIAAWLGFELDLRARQLSQAHIRNLESAVTIMGRAMTAKGIRRPEDVTKAAMVSYMSTQAKLRRGNGFRNCWQHLSSFWRWWSAEESQPNPMASIPSPKLPQVTTPVLAPKQIEALLRTAAKSSPRDHALVLLLITTGLRRAELASLNIEDVDVKAQTALVRKGKLGRSRTVCFGDTTSKALWRHLRRRESTGPLFKGYRGKRLTAGTVGDVVRRLGLAAGIEGLHPHALRHAWAHYMLSDGAQEHDLMKLAGWTSTAQLSRYGAAMSEQRAIAAGHRHQVLAAIA